MAVRRLKRQKVAVRGLKRQKGVTFRKGVTKKEYIGVGHLGGTTNQPACPRKKLLALVLLLTL